MPDRDIAEKLFGLNRRAPLWIAGGVALTLAAVALVGACTAVRSGDETVTVAGEIVPARPDYNWDVRPILSQNCFSCHGNQKQEAGLRLDQSKIAYGKLPDSAGRRAIVPGKPGASEMIRRITSADPDIQMPPKETHKTLSTRDLEILKLWIKQGARYEQHWAYATPRKVSPGGSPWNDRAVNPIDRYVFARLAAQKIAPSKDADREILINRVTLDLTGLPPSLAEVDAFVADKSADAYETVVDRLLASRHYAERQANVWLDVARYADSDGFQFDNAERFQHPYRDWVISAFQRNIPYDKFVTWQLAGDKLPNPTREQILATAFTRMGKRSNEGGIIDEEYRVEYGLERTELVGKAFLGLTVGCAKCHDHKYDVISQRDFYSMYGFFNQVDERGIAQPSGYSTPMGPTLSWPTPKQSRDIDAAHTLTVTAQARYDAALQTARRSVAARADAVMRQSPAQRLAFLQAASAADLQAYYPLDAAATGNYAAITVGPDGVPLVVAKARLAAAPAAPPGPAARPGLIRVAARGAPPPAASMPPADADPDLPRLAGVDIDKAQADARAAKAKAAPANATRKPPPPPALPSFMAADKLTLSPSGLPGGAPAALNNVKLVKGVKGQAALIDDSIGMADPAVGFFDRTQPFSLNVWVRLRAGKSYEAVNLLYNRFQAAGREGPGYELQLQANHLRFALVHSQPYNSLAILAKTELPKGRWVHVTATYDGSSRAAGAKLYVDGAPVAVEVEHDRLTRSSMPLWGRGPFDSSYGFSWGKSFTKEEFAGGALDEIKVFTRALTPIEVAAGHNAAAAAAVSPGEAASQITDIIAARDPGAIAAGAALRRAREAEQKIEGKVHQITVMGDAPLPRRTFVLTSGLYNVPKEEVQTQAPPRVFRWAAKYPRDRLGLAQWLFDPKNPLTARVYVNRLWQQHFGTGIVETLEDFGTQGANPTNPELLDWLAIEFQRSGWDIRHMQKLMVMSATYRQSSDVTPELLKRDSRNLLLARGPRSRLPAELIRDNALFASGLLVDRAGGDSVFPYQPQGVWDSIGVPAYVYPTDVPADEMHRRSMYTFIRRNAAYPSLSVFDMPDRNTSTVSRRTSNTPLQALVLLNDPQYMEAYRKLAERAMSERGGDAQLTLLFRLATRRHPTPTELDAMRRYRQAEVQRLSGEPAAVDKLLTIGVAPPSQGTDRVQLAAMAMVTAGVMNTPDAYSIR